MKPGQDAYWSRYHNLAGRMSFRAKTILGVGLIEAVLLALLIFSVLSFLHDSHDAQMQRYSRATVASFAAMTKDSVLALDLARLQAFTEELVGNPGIAYARVLDAEGMVLAKAGSDASLAPGFQADQSLGDVLDGIFDVAMPIEAGGQTYGRVEVGISVADVQATFARTRLWSLAIASGEMLLVALFSLALGTYLTRQLAHLKEGARRIAGGDLGYQVPVRGADELAATAEAFNAMSESLRTRNEQLAAIFALSPDGFLSLDDQGRVRLVNAPLCAMLGLEEAQLIGRSQAELELLLRDQSTDEHPYSSLGELQKRRVPAKLHVLSADLHVPPPSSLVFQVKGPPSRMLQVTAREGNDPQVALLLNFRDVTHEQEVDRMKSEFLSTAAHELRTPMASIMGFSELLLRRTYNPDMAKDMLDTIHRQSMRLTNMLNELLDLARIEARAGKDFKFSIQPLQQLVCEAVATATGINGSAVHLDIADDLPMVRVDPAKFQQALLNILSNAYKYSPDGGAVEVCLYQAHGPDGGARLCLSVRDRGIGMTPEHAARVFERFFRADASGNIPGTGLGMSLVKEIVELHGGDVGVESVLGSGTAVTIRLPVVEVEAMVRAA